MKRIRWQLVIILLTGLVVGALLLTQKQPTSVARTPEPTTGGIYTEGLIGSFKRFNPIVDSYNQSDRDVDRLIFSSLIRFDSRGNPQPDLASAWGVSNDGTIYNFRLRDNLVWQDGKPITSDDVIFTYGLMHESSTLISDDLRALWKDVEIKKLDAKDVQFRLPEPFAPFLDYLTLGILPQHLLGSQTLDQIVASPFNMQPVGSGPYQLDHLIVDNNQVKGVVLGIFDKYYGKKPYIQQFVFRYYPDSAAALQAYDGNEIQGIGSVSQDIFNKVLNQTNLSLYTAQQPNLSLVLFNGNDKDTAFLQDAKVRRALMQGLNRQWILDHILKGQAVLADGPLFPGTWAYYSGVEKISFDPTLAAKALKDDGYSLPTDGNKIWEKASQPISFTLLYPDDDQHKAVAGAIQKNWTDMNIEVKLEAVSYDQLVSDRLGQRNYQAALVDLNLSRTPDPDPYPFWDQAQMTKGQNYTQWNNRTASEYLEQARITMNIVDRTKLYRNFQVLFMKDLPAIPLYYPVYTYAVDRQVQGIRMGSLFDPADRFANVTDWFLAAKQAGSRSIQPSPTAQK
ncbi:MAG TPA: peptide ABC transporter substrate-binding protein [Anaerolineaceae bacterium]